MPSRNGSGRRNGRPTNLAGLVGKATILDPGGKPTRGLLDQIRDAKAALEYGVEEAEELLAQVPKVEANAPMIKALETYKLGCERGLEAFAPLHAVALARSVAAELTRFQAILDLVGASLGVEADDDAPKEAPSNG